jgi:hypothetical protein
MTQGGWVMSDEAKQDSVQEPEETGVEEQAPAADAIEDLAPEASDDLAAVKGGVRLQ